MEAHLTMSGWDEAGHQSDVWQRVEQRLALYLGASGVDEAWQRAHMIRQRLETRHGRVTPAAAMHLGLAAVGHIEPSAGDRSLPNGTGAPEPAPLLIQPQTIEPVTSKLRLSGINTLLASLIAVVGLR